MTKRLATQKLAAELHSLELQRQQGPLADRDARHYHALLAEFFRRLSPSLDTERRAWLRLPTDVEVRMRLDCATITCQAHDLSLDGLSLRGQLWIDERQELLIESLRAEDRHYPLAIRARLVWKALAANNTLCAGLRFIDLDSNARRQICSIYDHVLLNLLDRVRRGALPIR